MLAAHLALKAVPTEVLGTEGAAAEPKPGAAERSKGSDRGGGGHRLPSKKHTLKGRRLQNRP